MNVYSIQYKGGCVLMVVDIRGADRVQIGCR